MTFLRLLFVIFILSGCLKTENSDSNPSGVSVGAGDSVEFIAAKTLFSGSCSGTSCHNSFASMTEAQFKAQGLVVGGDPDNSRVYCRCTGSTGSCGSKNMPSGQPALTPSELQVISDWIMAVAP